MTDTTPPPVLVYLPPLAVKTSTGPAIAEMLAERLTQGPGTFAVDPLPDVPMLTDGRRITRAGGGPVLDVYTHDYVPRLTGGVDTGSGGTTAAVVLRFLGQLRYLARAVLLLRNAAHRAKGRKSIWQVIYGLALFGALAVVVAVALYAVIEVVLRALGVQLPTFGLFAGDLTSGWAVGLGATALGLLLGLRKLATRLAGFLTQTMDYLQNPRHRATVCSGLAGALDVLIEKYPGREINILAYSFGSLVAIDTFFPKNSQLTTPDQRYVQVVRSLATVGCPVDFVRLYQDDYLEQRTAVVPGLRWLNIFIPADVMGSNFHNLSAGKNGDPAVTDSTEEPPDGIRIDREVRTSSRYSDQALTGMGVLVNKGFLSHGGYWGKPGEDNCLDKVIDHLGLNFQSV